MMARAVVVPEARAIIVAPRPAQPTPMSMAAPGRCAFIASAKYQDACRSTGKRRPVLNVVIS